MGRSRIALSGLLAGGMLLVAYAVSLFLHARPGWLTWVHELVPTIVPLTTAAICGMTAARSAPEARASWALFAAGAFFWGAGDAALVVLNVIGIEPAGSFTVADAGYIALVPAWLGALLLDPTRRGERLIGGTIDAVTIFTAAASLTIAFAIIPIIEHGKPLEPTIITLFYPVGDLVLISAFLVTVFRAGRASGAHVFIGAALAGFLLGDVIDARLALTGAYEVGSRVDLTWTLAFVALAVATRAGRPSIRAQAVQFSGPLPAVVGFVSVAGLAVPAIVSPNRDVLLVGAILVSLLRSTRLLAQLRENRLLVGALERSMQDIEAMARAREEFVAAASHQLRTPLTSVRLRLDEIRNMDAVHGVAAQYVDEIDEQIERLQRMTASLLRMRASEFAATPRRVSVGGAIDRVLGHVQPLASRRHIIVRTDVEEDATALAANGVIEEVLLILIENAVKFSPDGGTVEARARARDGRCVVEVSDDGPGMSRDTLDRAFDPFFRASPSRSGFGLGLSIAKRLCEAAGAAIALESGPQGGAIARVEWPAAAAGDGSQR